jgi:hypothetical protein
MLYRGSDEPGNAADVQRDYRLYELTDGQFEWLVVRIGAKMFGEGVISFAAGKDGGRDAKFHGTAAAFPNPTSPLRGHFVLQAKHVSRPYASCSDRDFAKEMRSEHKKIKRLHGEGICDHYFAFTNRRLTGGADEIHVKAITALGPTTGHIIAVEYLHRVLDDHKEIADSLPNRLDSLAFRFNPDDIVEVIGAIHDYAGTTRDDQPSGAKDFNRSNVRSAKNALNGLSQEFWDQIVVPDSMPHFDSISTFLKNPRNRRLRRLYEDTTDELKQKILAYRDKFESFDKIFPFLYDQVQQRRERLEGRNMLTPTKLLDLDSSVLRVAAIMLKALNPRGVMEFEQLRGVVKTRVGEDGELAFMPALSFLYALGRIEYHTHNDTLEFRNG